MFGATDFFTLCDTTPKRFLSPPGIKPGIFPLDRLWLATSHNMKTTRLISCDPLGMSRWYFCTLWVVAWGGLGLFWHVLGILDRTEDVVLLNNYRSLCVGGRGFCHQGVLVLFYSNCTLKTLYTFLIH